MTNHEPNPRIADFVPVVREYNMVLENDTKDSVAASALSALGEVPIIKYFEFIPGALASRGGVIRFFLLAAGIEPKEEKIKWADWDATVKAQVLKNGENPAGHLPVIFYNGKALFEHVSVSRLLARNLGLYGKDADLDFLVDQISEEYIDWRSAWVPAVLKGGELKKQYLAETRHGYYRLFETLAERAHATDKHIVGHTLTFADALVFGILWDDIHAFGNDALPDFPTLNAFYQAFGEQPAIKKWCVAYEALLKAA